MSFLHLYIVHCTVIRLVSISAKFGIFTVMGLNGTLVELVVPSAYFSFNKGPIEIHDGANVKFSTK